MSGGDESFLESFIEGLATVPHDIKRNMELIRDLDKSSSAKADELVKAQEQNMLQVKQKMRKVRVVETPDGSIRGMHLVDDDADQDENNNDADPVHASIPTTSELFDYTFDPKLFHQIHKLQQECLQKGDEKVLVAQQAFEMIDSRVRKLDHDLQAMETQLQATGAFDTEVTVKPDDLAACQVTPGSEWILAKVIEHDPHTGMYKLADEDVESNKSKFCRRNHVSHSCLWNVQASILYWNPSLLVFDLPDTQVQVLLPVDKLRSGDTVYAVYPDTTSFYKASVVQAPRRQGNGAPFVMVNFHDDADEFGVTHDKAVSTVTLILFNFVIRYEFGFKLTPLSLLFTRSYSHQVPLKYVMLPPWWRVLWIEVCREGK